MVFDLGHGLLVFAGIGALFAGTGIASLAGSRRTVPSWQRHWAARIVLSLAGLGILAFEMFRLVS
jgi:hypothetical protein